MYIYMFWKTKYKFNVQGYAARAADKFALMILLLRNFHVEHFLVGRSLPNIIGLV